MRLDKASAFQRPCASAAEKSPNGYTRSQAGGACDIRAKNEQKNDLRRTNNKKQNQDLRPLNSMATFI